ncbi:hypothetical protein [Desulfitobacterium hafniense]|nr:hypothetical protein [Desulfitobacterium hafniense]KTE93189.1 hypothetical protein AT727_15785 [Desulfitobacterium hafniense]MEA5022262.1 hypothetical protein [Desulfitobacterium hafniense]CDX02042.1 Hypothetical protein DPCES_2155 [Desulfitobacterium hafniense]
MTKQRITIISLVSMLIFGLLLSGKLLYENKWLEGSLIKESQQISGVLSAEILDKQGASEMLVNTGQVTNLQSLCTQLKTISGKHPIRLVDQRTPELEEVYQQMQFAIQEGMVMGNFTQMRETLAIQAEQAGVVMNLTMDNEGIYLVLTQGEHQLVSVIERHGQGTFLPSVGRDYPGMNQ